MNKKKFAIRFLSRLEKFEHFLKIINKKINSNKISKKIESITKKRVNGIRFLSPNLYIKKLRSLFNKKIELPAYLTSYSFSKGIRIFIKNRYGVIPKLNNSEGKEKNKKIRSSIITIKLGSLFNNFKFSIGRAKDIKDPEKSNKFSINILKSFILLPNKIKSIKFNNFLKNKRIKVDKDSHSIGVLFYGDHLLTIASIVINRNNQILVKGVIEVPVPGDVIGNNTIENKKELSNILLDLVNILKLEKTPLLVVLSSSFFKVNTFFLSELKEISNTDNKVQSKSPYLPNETFIEFLNLSKQSEEQKLVRAVYTNRKLIESWTDTLELTNNSIIGITPSAPNIFDALKIRVNDETTVLIEIEVSKTVVMIGRNSTNLTSRNIPYGSSLYISDNEANLSINYFQRIFSSIEYIMSEFDERTPPLIYVFGKGLDDLVKRNTTLPNRFKRLSEMDLVDYSYAPRQMQIHESASKSIESTIETLSLIASCL
tara:strand:- start:69 stop:1523 length:1455 start_codon:yes stop_codon:yes gene_type:complete